MLELPGAAEAQCFLQEGRPDDQLALQPHQRARARLSAGAGGIRVVVNGDEEKSPAIGRRVGTFQEVRADHTDRIGDRAGSGLPEPVTIAQLGMSLGEIRDT